MNPIVSIIMPTYNCAQTIVRSIDSVLAQTLSSWELLIVDDCSTDNTTAILLPYLSDPRIHYTLLPKNSGASVARNTALRQATGSYIAFLDSDDIWMPKKLEQQLSFMQLNHYAFTYTNYYLTHQPSFTPEAMVTGPKHISQYTMQAFCWPGCLTVMYNRLLIGDIQITPIQKNNDYAMWLQICKKFDCFLLDESLAIYNHHEGSISNTSYINLIKWHYRLWHDVEHKNSIASCLWTFINIICGIYKKIRYVRPL